MSRLLVAVPVDQWEPDVFRSIYYDSDAERLADSLVQSGDYAAVYLKEIGPTVFGWRRIPPEHPAMKGSDQ